MVRYNPQSILNFENDRKPITTDHMGKGLEIKKKNPDVLPRLQHSVIENKIVDSIPSRTLTSIKSSSSLKKQSTTVDEKQKPLTDTKKLIKHLMEKYHNINDGVQNGNKGLAEQHEMQINNIDVGHGVRLCLVGEKKDSDLNIEMLMNEQDQQDSLGEPIKEKIVIEVKKRDSLKQPNRMTRAEYDQYSRQFQVDLSKLQKVGDGNLTARPPPKHNLIFQQDDRSEI